MTCAQVYLIDIDGKFNLVIQIVSAKGQNTDNCAAKYVYLIGASLSEPHTSERFHMVNHEQQKMDKNECRLKYHTSSTNHGRITV